MLILRQPCLGRVTLSPAKGDGDGDNVSLYFWAFVLWQLSLSVFCDSSESQSSSGRILASVSELRDRSSLSTDVLATVTVSIGAAKNPAVTRDVLPTACVPALIPGPVSLCPLCF